MITTKVSAIALAAGLLAVVSVAPSFADQTQAPTEASEKVALLQGAGEVPLGLLIKTPEIPHGVSFSRQVA